MPYTFQHGSGTEQDPYQVWTAADLDGVRDHLDKHFVQMADIDLAGYANWEPITTFPGVYQGCKRFISNLSIDRSATDEIGLFGVIQGTVREITVRGTVIGRNHVGGVAGQTNGANALLERVSFIGDVTGAQQVGGIIGSLYGAGNLARCFSAGTVTATGTGSGNGHGTGGIAGYGGGYGHQDVIEKCFSKATVTGTATGDSAHQGTGGIVGYIGSGSILRNCFAGGAVRGATQRGGLVGSLTESAKVEYCHSYGEVEGSGTYIGGLLGRLYHGTITSSYYDTETSGQSDTGKGTPKTTAEMMQQATFQGWDFTEIWVIVEGVTYPLFQWAGGTAAFTVLSARYGTPIEGATVVAADQGAGTNDAGLASIGNLAPGNIFYTVSKDGYATQSGAVMVAMGETTQVTVHLQFAQEQVIGYPPGTRIRLQFKAGDSDPYPMGVYWVDRNDHQTGQETLKLFGRNSIGKFLREQTLDEHHAFPAAGARTRFQDMLTEAGLVRFIVAAGGKDYGATTLDPNTTYLEAIREFLKLQPGWLLVENMAGTIIIAPTGDENLDEPGELEFYRNRDIFGIRKIKDDREAYTRVCAHTGDYSLTIYRDVESSLAWRPVAPRTFYSLVPDGTAPADAEAYADHLAELCRDSGEIEEFIGPFRPHIMPGDEAAVVDEVGTRKVGIITTVRHEFGKPGFLTLPTIDSGGRLARARFDDLLQLRG